MEPRFPGIPHQHPSNHIPPPFHHSLFPEQGPRPGFMCLEIGRIHPEGYPEHPHPHPHPHPCPYPFVPPQSYEIQESIEREIEKSRIREEIIMGEVMRRRMLESEVRRELMMERELGLRRGTNGFRYGLPSIMGFDSPVRFSVEDERNLLLQADRERLKGNFEGRFFGDHPFQRGTARVSEVKSVSEGGKQKERIILLAKPDEISRSKRKAIAAPDAGENLSEGILKKRAKEEWSCALCQVSATSEFALKEHLEGKRHKAKEVKLKTKCMGKGHTKGALWKKTLKIEGSVNPTAEDNLKLIPSLPAQTVLQDKNHPTPSQTPEQSDNPKKKMKFYCEMCKVGAANEKVMEGHKNGKKHLLRLQKLNNNVGTNQSDQPVEDEKTVALDKVAKPLNESKLLDSDHVPTDAVVQECKTVDELDNSDHVPTGAVDQEECKTIDEPDNSDHVSTDAVEQEECKTVDEPDNSDHMPTDAVEQEGCKIVDVPDTKQNLNEPDTKEECVDDASNGSNDKSIVDA